MSCICQYFGTLQKKIEAETSGHSEQLTDDKTNTTQCQGDVSATELANSRAENWVLKKKLTEAEIAIENLEKLVTTIVEKQHQLLSDMYALRSEHNDLQNECRLQREYHTMERNAMIREQHDMKLLVNQRTQALEQSNAKNGELMRSVQLANEKIYDMGIRFLKYKSAQQSRAASSASVSSCNSTN